MEPASNPARKIDHCGSVLVAFLLIGGAGVAFLGATSLARLHVMLAEVDSDLPLFFKALSNLEKFHGLDALILMVFVLGVLALVLIRDRLRANLYAALIAMLMVAFGGIFYLCGALPLMRVTENLGQ